MDHPRRAFLVAPLFAFVMTAALPGLWLDKDSWLVTVWTAVHLVVNFGGWILALATQFLGSQAVFLAAQFLGALLEALLVLFVARSWRMRRRASV